VVVGSILINAPDATTAVLIIQIVLKVVRMAVELQGLFSLTTSEADLLWVRRLQEG